MKHLLLDGRVFQRRSLAENMVEAGDGLKAGVVKAEKLSSHPLNKRVERDLIRLPDHNSVLVLLASMRGSAPFLVQINQQLDFASQRFRAPGEFVAIEDEAAFTERLLNGFRLPDSLDETSLLGSIADEDIVLVSRNAHRGSALFGDETVLPSSLTL